MNIQSVTFYNQEIQVLDCGGKHYVAMKSIVENIGLDWDSQKKRISRNEVLNSTKVMMTSVAKDGKSRELLCLPLGMLNGWLAGVEISRCKLEVQPVLRLYQLECFDVLYKYFMPVSEHSYPVVKSNIANAPENLNSSRTFAVALMNNGLRKYDEITLAYDMLADRLSKVVDEIRQVELMIHKIDVNSGDIHDGFAESKTYLFLDEQIYKDAMPIAEKLYKPLDLQNI